MFCFENASWYLKHIVVQLVYILIFPSQLWCTVAFSLIDVEITLEAIGWAGNLV